MGAKQRERSVSEWLQGLRGSGLKKTPQRSAIVQALVKSDRHLTGEEVYQRVKRSLLMVSRATIYRNLEHLVEEGFLRRLERSGRAVQYDSNLSQHHHFFCVECSKVVDVYLKTLSYQLDRKHSGIGRVEIKRSEIQLHGICSACLKKKNSTR